VEDSEERRNESSCSTKADMSVQLPQTMICAVQPLGSGNNKVDSVL